MSKKIFKTIETDLSVSSLNKAIREIKALQQDLEDKCMALVKALAEEGIKIAKMQVVALDAVDTGNLERSISAVFFPEERCGVVYTDVPYAVYVEYGTGVVGAANPHPAIGGGELGGVVSMNGKKQNETHAHLGYGRSFAYDAASGETKTTESSMGWVYMDRNGNFFFTRGYPSRPFMYNTLEMLREVAESKAEVFWTEM